MLSVFVLCVSAVLAVPVAHPRVTPAFSLGISQEVPNQSDAAQVKVITNIPSVNVDDVPGLFFVSCTSKTLNLYLRDPLAVQDWTGQVLWFIDPKWKCAEKSVYYLSSSAATVSRHKASFAATRVLPHKFVDRIELAIGSPSKERKEYVGGYQVNWNPPKPSKIADLSSELNIEAVCDDCFINGSIYLRANLTLSKLSLDVDIYGKVDSNFDVSVKAAARDNLIEASKPFYVKPFPSIDLAGLAVMEPKFLVAFGAAIPAGPQVEISTGFDFKVPEFETRILGSKNHATEKGFHPHFRAHPFKTTPVMDTRDIFKSSIKLIPKFVVEVTLSDGTMASAGFGIDNYLEGNIRAGSNAYNTCPSGYYKVTVDAASRLQVYMDRTTTSLAPWFGKRLIDKCYHKKDHSPSSSFFSY